MLRGIETHWRTILLLAAIWIVFECFVSWAAFCPEGQTHSANHQGHEKDYCVLKGPVASIVRAFLEAWSRIFHHADAYVALFTALLFISTVALWLATNKLWRASEDALHATQRAIVTTKGINSGAMYGDDGKVVGWIVDMLWENTGPTTALSVNAGSTYQLVEGTNDPTTVVFVENPIVTENMTIGPRNVIASSRSIPIADLTKVWRGEARIFILARAEYKDVFGIAHHTQACSEIKMFSNPAVKISDPDKIPRILHYSIWREHNSSN